ncbi:hypothetical protein I9X82_00215, partial [Campylobacter jejuni]|nr:hypothetical protein [Campylobacter jejuni]
KEQLKSKLETELQIQQDLERELKNSVLNDLLKAMKSLNLELRELKHNSQDNSYLESEYKELLEQYKTLETEPLNEQILQEIHESYLNDTEAIFQKLLEKYLHLVDLKLNEN